MIANLPLLIALCAPAVHSVTANALISHESAGNPWAVGVNGARVSRQPSTREQAISLAHVMVAKGFSVDVGLAQINSRTLEKLGLSIEQAFEPCVNLQAMQTVLTRDYNISAQRLGEGQPALQAALSIYNTGNMGAGLRNGYVRKVYLEAQAVKPHR
jgi:type IV secretion system protein VirB1